MTPVLPLSNSSCFALPGNAFITRKECFERKCSILRKSRKQIVPAQRYAVPLSTSAIFFSPLRTECAPQARLRTHRVTATGTDVVVEEASPTADDKEPDELPGSVQVPAEASEASSVKSDPSPAQSKRPRAARTSDMPPLKNEDLIPGATFTGKVRSIQPFGAFVDFGAFTDGLVHISRLSDGFVKDVNDVVSVGQEVTVRLVEANTETRRISLTMRSGDEASKPEQKESTSGSERSRSPRKSTPSYNQKRNEPRKNSKFVRGQELEGTVKNLTRSGAFISLPEGEEGFLPKTEEAAEGFGNMLGETSLQVGQEVKVRVLRFNRGQLTLTMKSEVDTESDTIVTQSAVHTATNPFVLAFRRNKDISAFLDEQQQEKKPTLEVVEDAQVENDESIKVDSSEIVGVLEGQEGIIPDASLGVDSAIDETGDEQEEIPQKLAPEASTSVIDDITEVTPIADEAGNVEDPDLSPEISSGTLLSESKIDEEASESVIDDVKVDDEVQSQVSVVTEEVEPEQDNNASVASSSEPLEVASVPGSMTEASEAGEEVPKNEVDDSEMDVQEPVLGTVEVENSTLTAKVEEVEPVLGNIADVSSSPEQNDVPESKEATSKASILPAIVKQLREESGAGMMDCKKALLETGGDIIKAQEYLRKKGLASADKKASRTTAEGRIGAYIHDSRIGVLIEVNCETDFVARGDIFKELVEDLAMQVAACPQVQYIDTDEVPRDIVDKEREIEMQKEDLLSKPEQIRSKIVDGRISKRLQELALLEQPYIKNDKTVVKDWVKQTIATIGENIKVKRFARYNLGEGLEKKSQDFAAEVAAQTTAKPPASAKEQPAVVEATATVEEPPKATVSAALVKQLREETGAGMMDCKKALSETGGDLEKAQEYLRKKGLSSADKKSSRLAAEGRIGSYIHDSRIGVLIEVNCETDFVGRSEKFKNLVDDLAMQVVACPQVQCVSLEDVPAEIINREKELEMQREDLQSKPENIREKIVEGRVSKRLGELALLEQPFIKDDSVLVKDLVKQSVAAIGENIKVRRFIRFTLGEETGSKKDEE